MKALIPLPLPLLLIACQLPPGTALHRDVAGPEPVQRWFAKQPKQVITFLGYSGSGYEDPALMLDTAAGLLDDCDPGKTIVNIGATVDGIGAVYALAQERRFETTGIVSSKARAYADSIAPGLRVFFIEDDAWGGYLEDGSLSPTSEAMVSVSKRLIAIGGGAIARDEMAEARKRGIPVTFIEAESGTR